MQTYTVKVKDDGSKFWYQDDHLHRLDGPAVEHPNGTKLWYIEAKRHREDGPAEEYTDGKKYWYLKGKGYSEQDFNRKMNSTKELTVQEISDLLGYEVKIVKG